MFLYLSILNNSSFPLGTSIIITPSVFYNFIKFCNKLSIFFSSICSKTCHKVIISNLFKLSETKLSSKYLFIILILSVSILLILIPLFILALLGSNEVILHLGYILYISFINVP